MKENDKAIADLTEAIRLDSDFEYACNNRAVAYNRKGDKEKALADIERALAIVEFETAKENRKTILYGGLRLWFE